MSDSGSRPGGTCPIPSPDYDVFSFTSRSPVLSSLPPISVQHGAITYPGIPAPPSKARQAWNDWGPRRKAVAARKQVERTVARGRAFCKRVSDTRAVWNETKRAYSDREIDEITEDCW